MPIGVQALSTLPHARYAGERIAAVAWLVAVLGGCGSDDACKRADEIKEEILDAWSADNGLDMQAAGPGAAPCVLRQEQRDAIVAVRKAAGSTRNTDYAALCRQFEEAASDCKG